MPKTLLAVDDSATMRKVLEITFSGEDFRVTGADGASSALARMGEEPAAAVIDASLGSDDGYALAKELRSRSGRLAIVLLASRHSPYDAARGRDAGVDDFIDKPFDTQALIDKVKKALVARESGRVAAPPAPAPTVAAAQTTASFGASPPRPPPPAAPVAAPKPVWPTQRTHTLSFEGTAPSAAAPAPAHSVLSRTSPSGGAFTPQGPAAPPPAPAPPAPASVPAAHAQQPTPAPLPRAAPAAAVAPAAAAIATSENGRLAGKLDQLGLTSQQIEAVLALSREVVEQVVWEVVPQLAEALIKEEIARLTREPE